MKISAVISFFILAFLFTAESRAGTFEVLNYNSLVYQGGVLVVKIHDDLKDKDLQLFAFDELHPFNDNGLAFVGIGVDHKPERYILYLVETSEEKHLQYDFFYTYVEVLATTFEKTRVSRYTGRPIERTDRQKKIIDSAYDRADKSVDLTGGLDYVDPLCFARDVIDPFGFIYRNNPYRKHEGVDLRTPVGMPVRATNAGKVILVARNFKAEGNMIILNHGLGIFSVYMHLSRFHIKQGDVVKREQLIASSGRSGAGVREPHLHFSIKVGPYVDPFKFIETFNSVFLLSR